jgi:hypothetical protein
VISSTPNFIGSINSNPIEINKPDLGADTTLLLNCVGDVVNLLPLYNTSGLTFNWNTINTTAAPAGNYQLY